MVYSCSINLAYTHRGVTTSANINKYSVYLQKLDELQVGTVLQVQVLKTKKCSMIPSGVVHVNRVQYMLVCTRTMYLLEAAPSAQS